MIRSIRKSVICSALLFAQLIPCQADPSTQNSNSISNTASPNAYSFMKFQESPVNYYNGRSSFTIPIFEINVGGLSYPISLNYSQGGIQVNSVASDVGLGWSLSSSFINRTVVGDADLESITDTNLYYPKTKYGYFDYKEQNLIPNYYGEYHNVDFYPDMFQFFSPSENSKFYFKNRTEPIELDHTGSKITWTTESKMYDYLKNAYGAWVNNLMDINDYKEFELITKSGISYYFNDKDISHSFTRSLENFYDQSFGSISGTYPRVSSWNITQIKNMNNDDTINFIYEPYSSETTDDRDNILQNHLFYRYESKYPSKTVPGIDNNLRFGSDQASYESDYGKYYQRALTTQRIKNISFRGGSVEFYYGLDRLDLINGKALTNIKIKNANNSVVKEFDLEYGYFYSTLQKNEFSKRLKLLSVKEKGYNKYQFTYYESAKLPNIGSPLQDFFGYNNSNETAIETPNNVTSKYYYYPGKSEYSILPYDIPTDNNHYLLQDENSVLYGQIDKQPNDLSKIWSLESVKLPTGGIKKFVLESNVFNLWGNNLKGGGTRLQKQVIQEEVGAQQRTINYYYNLDANTSSGYLFNIPDAGYPTSILFPKTNPSPDLSSFGNDLKSYFLLFNNAKINFDLLNNFFIGYSKIEENENGLKTIYEFKNEEVPNILRRAYSQDNQLTSLPLHPVGEFMISNSAYGNSFYIDNSYKRGKLKFVSLYDKNNILQLKTENIYRGFYGQLGEDFYHGYVFPGTSIFSDKINNYSYELMEFEKSYYGIPYNLIYSKSTSYLPSGNVENEVKMDYDLANQNLRWVANKIGDGVVYPQVNLKRFKYPYDFANDPSTMMDKLVEINKIGTPVLVQNEKGEINPTDFANLHLQNLVAQSKVLVSKDANTSNLILPVQTMAAIGTNDFYEIGKLQRYDNKGNLLQYSTKAGISTTFIYGYHQTLPIAKIEGATYEQVMTALSLFPIANSSTYLTSEIVLKSDLDKDAGSENLLIVALDSFRKNPNLADFQITTYTYDPLVGITSVTPPSGLREIYTYYDITNKLKEVKRQEKDAGGNFIYRILQKNEYHYKP